MHTSPTRSATSFTLAQPARSPGGCERKAAKHQEGRQQLGLGSSLKSPIPSQQEQKAGVLAGALSSSAQMRSANAACQQVKKIFQESQM
eukprot:1096669-Pelagomonas_calceolata.AAC.1